VNWRDSSACSGMTELFFPDTTATTAAKAVCADCPVTEQCRSFADEHLIPHGVWGGESGADRRERLRIDKVGRRLYPDDV
jgi:WhiB family transcriptional regulator, redox-sensing transcriptional regulator